jgi:hypothetical protein
MTLRDESSTTLAAVWSLNILKVQFVNFHAIERHPLVKKNGLDTMFGLAALMEVPEQYQKVVELGLLPAPVPEAEEEEEGEEEDEEGDEFEDEEEEEGEEGEEEEWKELDLDKSSEVGTVDDDKAALGDAANVSTRPRVHSQSVL